MAARRVFEIDPSVVVVVQAVVTLTPRHVRRRRRRRRRDGGWNCRGRRRRRGRRRWRGRCRRRSCRGRGRWRRRPWACRVGRFRPVGLRGAARVCEVYLPVPVVVFSISTLNRGRCGLCRSRFRRGAHLNYLRFDYRSHRFRVPPEREDERDLLAGVDRRSDRGGLGLRFGVVLQGNKGRKWKDRHRHQQAELQKRRDVHCGHPVGHVPPPMQERIHEPIHGQTSFEEAPYVRARSISQVEIRRRPFE